MDTNSLEVNQRPTITTSSADIIADESSNQSKEDNINTESVTKPEVKENPVKSKKIVVGSRYMQSTQNWVNKRTEDSHNSSQGSSSRLPSRSRTPERKRTASQKSSTPVSTDKSLNVSGISVINRVNEVLNKEKNPTKTEIKKYTKPLMGRKSMAPQRHLFDNDLGRSGPMAVTGVETQNRNKEFEESIKRSIYLQTLYLNLKAQQSRKDRKADGLAKISAVWKETNKMRDQLTEINKYVHSLEEIIESIAVLENQKSCLQKYFDIRSEVDPLFNELSELIDSQKKVFRIENCSEEDFNQISELLDSCPDSERLERATNVTSGLKTAEELVSDMKSMEAELKELHKLFDRCVKEVDKYESIENKVFPEKAFSLKKLF